MHTLRHHTRVGIALLIALLLVPLALGGHRHEADDASARTCNACVVAHHSPVVTAPIPVAPTPVVLRTPFTARPLVSCARGERPAPTGRGPPSSRPLHVV